MVCICESYMNYIQIIIGRIIITYSVENKLQVYTEDYTKYVVKHLVKIVGKSESDVVSFIIKQWMMEHKETLSDWGISVDKAKKERKI